MQTATDTQYNSSMLRIYSIGVAVKDKKPYSNMLMVTPLEHLSNIGENLSTYKKVIDKALDDWERVTTVNVTKRVRTEAEWFNIGDDTRVTPPDVCKGEIVILFRMADNERFFWVVKEKNYLLRKLEHVTWQFNNTPKDLEDAGHLGVVSERVDTPTGEKTGRGGRKPSEPVYQHTESNVKDAKSSTYWFEVSTRDKHILLQTSDNDEEKTIYQIKLDTKKGILSIKDKQQNSIVIHSEDRQITLTALDVVVEANLFVRGNVNVNNVAKIAADSGNTWVGGGLAVDGNAVVEGDVTTQSDLYAKGMSHLNGLVSMGDNANVAKTLTCEALVITGPFSALGSASFGGGGGGAGTTFDDSGALTTVKPAVFGDNIDVKSVDVTDTITAADADVSGGITSATADVSGQLNAAIVDVSGQLTADLANVTTSITSPDITASSQLSSPSANIDNATIGEATVSEAAIALASINGLRAVDFSTDNGTVVGDLSVAGTTTLANVNTAALEGTSLSLTGELTATTGIYSTSITSPIGIFTASITSPTLDELEQTTTDAIDAVTDATAQAVSDLEQSTSTAISTNSTAITDAASTGSGAQSTATAAAAAAAAADAKAATAQSTANSAGSSASSAQSTADNALNKANAAQSCCDTHTH